MSVYPFPTFHSFPLGLALMCFSRAWGYTKKGCLDKSLDLCYLLAKMPHPPCSPRTVPRAPGSGIITSFHPPLIHPTHWPHQMPMTYENNKKAVCHWLDFPLACGSKTDQWPTAPRGAPLPGLRVQPVLCPHRSAIPKNS